ncbi:restriction endonuclease subunit S [Streptomyces pseudogriseolus]|uniref:restriction endonuclease subunit S n=1 Tax=Streptomyces pseudogriseolus TaxID=36817 RepID=UPI003FA2CDD3
MAGTEHKPLGQLLRRPPRYGINAASVPLAPGVATYIRITDIDESGRFSPDPKVGVDHVSAANYRLAAGELVFARTGASVGKSYLYNPRDGELVYAGFLINVAPDPERLNPKYLSLFAQTKEYWDWIARTSVRSGQPGVNGREYAQLPVPLPDIATQNAIAAAMTDVDDLISTLERLIAKKQAIKQGMLQQLLTGRTRLPGFGDPWREARLGSLLKRPPRYGINAAAVPFSIDTHTYIRITDIDDSGRFTPQPRVGVRHPNATDYLLHDGELVFARTGASVGKSYLYDAQDGALVYAGFLINISPNPEVLDPKYLSFFAQTVPYWDWVARTSVRSGQPGINGREYAQLQMEVPDIREQRAIAGAVQKADEEIRLLGRRLTKIKAVKQGMMQQLLTGRTLLPAKESAA